MLRVTSDEIGYTLGDKKQQHVAATRRSGKLSKCVLENFCENLCLRNGVLSPHQVANSVAETKIFTKIVQ